MQSKEKSTAAAARARAFFFENQGASIDDAAREMKACHLALHKSDLSRIRRQVLAAISQGATSGNAALQVYHDKPLPAAKGYIVRKKSALASKPQEPFNPPKIRLAPHDAEADVTVAEAEAQQAVDAAAASNVQPPPPSQEAASASPVDATELKAAKLKYMEDLVLADPRMSLHKIQDAVIARYGSGLFAPAIAKALRIAREASGIPMRPQKEKAPPPPKTPTGTTASEQMKAEKEKVLRAAQMKLRAVELAVQQVATRMKEAGYYGVVKIEIDEDGGVSCTINKVETSSTTMKFSI